MIVHGGIQVNDIAIYVQGHTKLPFLFARGYIPIVRGVERKDIREDILVDTVGDNISDKETMPEINFLYWISKNADIPAYVGVCQYRRYFNFSGEKLKEDGSNFLDCVDTAHAIKLLQEADVILLHPNLGASKINIIGYYFKWHLSKYIFITFNVIRRMYPAYRSTFLQVMDSKVHHGRCIFVTKKQIFFKFVKFTTDVLFEVEQIALRDYPNEKRQERFLAYIYERIMEVFWIHNKLRIKECNLIQLSLNKT